MHVAEIPYEHEYTRAHYGGTTVSFLAAIGALGPNLLAAHSVWVDDQDIHNLARTATPVSHCPAAAMRVLGFARIPEMIAAGVTVGIGTDGAPSNNRMSMVDEMYLTFLVHKGRLLDPTVMPAQKVLEMATIDGAKALQWETDIGSLEVGKRADLVVIDPRTPNMLPLHDPVANLVSSMKSENVHSVMCDGAWLLRDRRLVTLDEPAILAEAGRRAADLRARAQITLPARFPMLTAAT